MKYGGGSPRLLSRCCKPHCQPRIATKLGKTIASNGLADGPSRDMHAVELRPLLADATPLLGNDPEFALERYRFQERDQPPSEKQQSRFVGTFRTEDNEAGMITRRKVSNVSKIQVAREHCAAFLPADHCDGGIGRPCHILIPRRHRVMPGLAKDLGGFLRHILVDLKLQGVALRSGIRSSSIANSAAYASAALRSSGVRPG